MADRQINTILNSGEILVQHIGGTAAGNVVQVKNDFDILDAKIDANTGLENIVNVDVESDLAIINIGGTDYNQLDSGKKYVLRKAISWTMGFAASGVYTGTIEITSSISFDQFFTNVDAIFYGDATNKFARLLITSLTIKGSATSSLFDKNALTPTQMSTWNFANGIIDGIEMGAISGASIVHSFSNITTQKSTWDIQVSGVNFLNINNVSVVGNTGSTPFGGSHIKVRGTTAGGLQMSTENMIPSGGDTMFDFTELSTALNLFNTHHFTIFGSGGVYGAGEDKTIISFADAGGGQVTVTSSNHGIPNGNSVDITGTTNYNGNFEISNATTNTFEITDTFVIDDATGTINATVVNQSNPLIEALGARGTGNPDSTSQASLSLTGNALETVISSIGVAVKINAVFILNGDERFITDTTGRLTYIGLEDVAFDIHVVPFYGPATGGTVNLSSYIALNGTVVTDTRGRTTASSSDRSQSTSLSLKVLSTGDFIEGFVANDDATTNIVAEDCKIIISKS